MSAKERNIVIDPEGSRKADSEICQDRFSPMPEGFEECQHSPSLFLARRLRKPKLSSLETFEAPIPCRPVAREL